MKKFTIPCDFGEEKAPFDVFIGDYSHRDYHPLHFQHFWLESERGGIIPEPVMESFQKLYELAEKNDINFEELCVYALDSADKSNDEKEIEEEVKEVKRDLFKSPAETRKSNSKKKLISNYSVSKLPFKDEKKAAASIVKEIISKTDAISIEASKLLTAYLYREFPFNSKFETILFNVYKCITSYDILYNICVIVDTICGKMHSDGFKYFFEFIHKKPKERMEIVQALNKALIDWAYKEIKTNNLQIKKLHDDFLLLLPPTAVINSATSPEELSKLAWILRFNKSNFEIKYSWAFRYQEDLWNYLSLWGNSDVLEDNFWSFRCYKKAAEEGYLPAESMLGCMYYAGKGCLVDDEKGTYWSKIAADKGSYQAQFNLANAYELGNGVEQDIEEALFWYKKSADQGIQMAIEKVEALEKSKASQQ